MDKHQVISLITRQLESGTISKNDLLQLAEGDGVVPSTTTRRNEVSSSENASKNLTHIFYGIGAIIAIIGICILVAQNWEEIGYLGRILVTLGISFVTYVAGYLFRNPTHKMLSQVMFLISAVLAPLGILVFLIEAEVNVSLNMHVIIGLTLTLIYGIALAISKRNILILITIGFATWAYYAFVMNLFGDSSYDQGFLEWAGILQGISYICIASGLGIGTDEIKERNSIKGVLYGFGTLAVLGAGIMIGGVFDLLYIALVFAAFYGSVYVKSRLMLTFASVFLMAHIVKLTSKYFVDSIGWPIALIIVGFLVIGVGYMTINLNKRITAGK